MSVTSRPFSGNWRMDSKSVVQNTPDCLVYINGLTTLPGCPSCNGRIDIQKYVTSVSVDPNTEPISTASISLSIPSFAGEYFFRDGDFLLAPGLEVVVYMRGYFARSILTDKDAVELGNGQTFNPSGKSVYPYYQVFHGVVTEASHEYSSGEHTASISCSDVLHFWQNLKISTNGAVFGPRPDGSLVNPTLQGHTFMGANPYSIIYTLYRIGFGAAGAVEFNLEQKTNVEAVSDITGDSRYKMAALWWESRWSSNSIGLRMYGADGSLYNAFTQAYLGAFAGKNPEALKQLVGLGRNDRNPFDQSSDKNLSKIARDLGYSPLSSQIAIGVDSEGNTSRQSATKQQAFCLDIGTLGNVNLFETEYLSKLEVANAVRTITGFEFYQDVTGDLVFKPPFYNMDTSSDPVYVIEDRDLVSIAQSEREPEATYIKGTGSHFNNTKGVGLEGWLGMTGTYVDYRLVAQFGWREADFESNYISDPRTLFIMGINRLDLVNVGMKSASITIPLRPEIRPGYPVYIRFLDCFYYVQSVGHQFQFGGSCMTTINGVAKRAKFNAPGLPPKNRLPTIHDIHLENPYLPPLPLTLHANEIESQQENEMSGPPRIQGFPNVVLGIDPSQVNAEPLVSVQNLPLDQIILQALSLGEMRVSPDALGTTENERRLNGPFVLETGEFQGDTVTRSELQSNWTSLQEVLSAGTTLEQAPTTMLQQIVLNVARQRGMPTEDKNLFNYLVLIHDAKSAFGIPSSVVGTYRYFSCSHPDPAQQGTSSIALDSVNGTTADTAPAPLTTPSTEVGFTNAPPPTTIRSAPDYSARQAGTPENDTAIFSAILTGLGAPVTSENLKFLQAWRAAEGGKALYNPFNTTRRSEGSTAYNRIPLSNGNIISVQNFVDQQQGIDGTIRSLSSSRYTAIVNALKANQSALTTANDPAVQAALATWGTGAGRGGVDVYNVLSRGNVPSNPVWTGDAAKVGINVGQSVNAQEGDDFNANVAVSISGDLQNDIDLSIADNQGFLNAEGSTVKYGTIRPKAGIKVLQFDAQPTDSDPLRVTTPEIVVPTSQIRFVTFAPHSFTLSTATVRAASGANYGAGLCQPAESDWTGILQGYIEVRASSSPEMSILDRYNPIFNVLLVAINDVFLIRVDNIASQDLNAIRQVVASAPTLEGVLATLKGADDRSINPSETVQVNYTGTRNAPSRTADARGSKAIGQALARAVAAYITRLLATLRGIADTYLANISASAAERQSEYSILYEARNGLLAEISAVAGVGFTPPVNPTDEVKITYAQTSQKATYTPVFPVSDERGYEVFGALPYGRGLNIQTYEQIMQSTANITVNGVQLSSRVAIGDISANSTTFSAIEQFYVELAKNKGDVSLAFGNLNPEKQQALLTAAADIQADIDVTAGTLDASAVTGITNLLAASQHYGQKTQMASNVPARLADISAEITSEPCSCKTSDAQAYLLAASGDYMVFNENDAINEFMIEEATAKAREWQASRDAMAGRALDPSYSSLAQQFVNTVNTYSNKGRGGV